VIEGHIVFVLGAGASRDYGFPLGYELVQMVLDKFSKDRSGRNKLLDYTGCSEGEVDEFVHALNASARKARSLGTITAPDEEAAARTKAIEYFHVGADATIPRRADQAWSGEVQRHGPEAEGLGVKPARQDAVNHAGTKGLPARCGGKLVPRWGAPCVSTVPKQPPSASVMQPSTKQKPKPPSLHQIGRALPK
jgi:hypothetical protein